LIGKEQVCQMLLRSIVYSATAEPKLACYQPRSRTIISLMC